MSSKHTVLIVEDEVQLQEIIIENFQGKGIHAVGARSINDAFAILSKKNKIDAIWLDHYLLGKEDGLDLASMLRNSKNPKLKNIPIFLVSNTVSQDKIYTYQKLGINESYVKSNFALNEIVGDVIKQLEI